MDWRVNVESATASMQKLVLVMVRVASTCVSNAGQSFLLFQGRPVPLILPHQAIANQAATRLVLITHQLMYQLLRLAIGPITRLHFAKSRRRAFERARIAH